MCIFLKYIFPTGLQKEQPIKNNAQLTKTLHVPAALSNFPFGLVEKPVVMLWFLFRATSLQKDNKNFLSEGFEFKAEKD